MRSVPLGLVGAFLVMAALVPAAFPAGALAATPTRMAITGQTSFVVDNSDPSVSPAPPVARGTLSYYDRKSRRRVPLRASMVLYVQHPDGLWYGTATVRSDRRGRFAVPLPARGSYIVSYAGDGSLYAPSMERLTRLDDPGLSVSALPPAVESAGGGMVRVTVTSRVSWNDRAFPGTPVRVSYREFFDGDGRWQTRPVDRRGRVLGGYGEAAVTVTEPGDHSVSFTVPASDVLGHLITYSAAEFGDSHFSGPYLVHTSYKSSSTLVRPIPE